ncbi:hypothetical protein CDL15_Pgr014207 [Punica granatum]|uniref:Uncharacterized protein n=1 Tax=Punica granatum TaxID=22663 RepID=A0A218XDE9_PUNGR|nr:hypothetical protein CDL15_Pgr014207 [Punica granatum]
MFYLASGYEERVGEVFESRVTRLNAWKSARVQRMHVRPGWACGSTSGVRAGHAGARQGTLACSRARGMRAGVRGYCSPESTVFARNEEINLK